MERALVHGDTRVDSDAARGPLFPVTAGAGVALLGVLGCAALSLFRPVAELGDEPIVMVRQTGALYVRIEDTLHPVLNLTSARLIAHSDSAPTPVEESALTATNRGPLLGIPGAPGSIGPPLPAQDSVWTICDGPHTTVIAGLPPKNGGPEPLSGFSTVLVAGPTGTVYLLYDGQRAALDPAAPAVARALRIDGVEPRLVSAALLNTIPEVPPIAVPAIPGAGAPGPDGLTGFIVGDVVRVDRAGDSEFYVVLDGGVQRVGAVAADLIRFGGDAGGGEIPAVEAAVVAGLPTLGMLPVSSFPNRTAEPKQQDEILCATWSAAEVTLSVSRTLPIAPGQQPVSLAQADAAGPAVDEVFVPPGRSLYVRPDGIGSPLGSVVADTGVRFPLADIEAIRTLGLPGAAAPAPWAVLSALPVGPELSRDAALVARDVIPPAGPAQPGQG